MKPVLVTTLFAVAVAYQLGIPASMVAGRERVLREGEALKILTAPVDPYDAFRGRYVALGFNTWDLPVAEPGQRTRRGQWLYVSFTNDLAGFAAPAAAAVRPPASGPYLRLRAQWRHDDRVAVRPPFDRYYLEESRAPEAERDYRAGTVRSNQNTYVIVRVRAGQGVLEELFVNGRPAGEIGK